MPDGYQRPDISDDPGTVAALAWRHLQSRMPGWNPAIPGAQTWLIEAICVGVATVLTRFLDVSDYVFARSAEIDGEQLVQAAPATATSTWTFIDTLPHTIAQGTPVRLTTSGGVEVEMYVADTYEHPGGTAATVDGAVQLVTVETGAALNDLNGTLAPDEPVSEVATNGIVLTSLLGNASDEESPAEFLDRVTRRRRLSTPRPVKAEEFAVFLAEEPDVAATAVIDLYRPADAPGGEATDIANATTVWVRGLDGLALTGDRMAELQALLMSMARVNDNIWVRASNYPQVDVTAHVIGSDPLTLAATLEAVRQKIRDHLYKPTWGVPARGDATLAFPRTKVFYNDLLADAGGARDVDRIATLTLGVHGGALSAADLTLTGKVPIPVLVGLTVTGETL